MERIQKAMKTGKAPEAILKRSVLKQLKNKRTEILFGAAVGEQHGILDTCEENRLVFSTNPFIGTKKEAGEIGLYEAVNDVAASGAEPVAILVSILLPARMEEKGLKRIMEDLRIQCNDLNVDVLGGHTEVTPAVLEPILTITAIGFQEEDSIWNSQSLKAGHEIVMTKWCGLSGTARLAARKNEELVTRYPNDFLNGAKAFKGFLSIQEECKVLKECSIQAVHHVAKGGIFGALWEFAAAGRVGLDIDLMKLPLKQETVEICEFFHLNPYSLESIGSLLIGTEHGNDIVDRLNRVGIPAKVIGKAVEGNDRLIRNEEEERYLEPPKSDELNKIFMME